MTKQDFVANITPRLKELGFKKKKFYWYRTDQELIQCICVEGSQWNVNNYYVSIGWAIKTQNNFPSQLDWYARARCEGVNGELNIHPDELFEYIGQIFSCIITVSQLNEYLHHVKAKKVVSRYWFQLRSLKNPQ